MEGKDVPGGGLKGFVRARDEFRTHVTLRQAVCPKQIRAHCDEHGRVAVTT